MPGPLISIVVPLLNEEGNLIPLYQELRDVIGKLKHFSCYEIIFVNDGSSDRSLEILKGLAQQDSSVKIVSFIRNFGHEKATTAGIYNASGDAIMLIDADRQDPANLMLEFEKAFLEGFHIIYGQRSKRLNESWLKKLTSKVFYPFFRWVTRVDMPRDVGDFCLLSRKAVECFKLLPEREIFVRGMIYWSGLAKKAVPFVRRSRASGVSKYNYSKLTIFALENIISFSTMPIYFIVFVSFGIIALCFLGGTIALGMHLLGRVVMTGWTSLMLCMLILFAATFFFLGILGLYIGKIFQEVKQRPTFVVDEKINFEQNNVSQSSAIMESSNASSSCNP